MSAEFIPFDLEAMRECPETGALGDALAAFVERLNQEHPMSQERAESVVCAMLRALPASDTCEQCGTFDAIHVPYALDLDREGAVCEYRCPEGHQWDCWWGPRSLIVQIP